MKPKTSFSFGLKASGDRNREISRAKLKQRTETIMIRDYIIVAVVYAIGLSFLGIIHYFWLRDVFKGETPPDGHVGNEGKREIHPVLNESSSKVGCQNSQFAIQASSGNQRNKHERFDPRSSASRSSAARTKLWNTTSI